MKLSSEETDILLELENTNSIIRRGRKSASYQEARAARLAEYERVGELINRYEEWLAQN